MRWLCISITIVILVAVDTSSGQAQPLVGWQAQLNQNFHNVSGKVSVVDEDTLQFDDFTFDGGGIDVYFYLGTEDSSTAFDNGLSIYTDLLGIVYDGTQPPFEVDLPAGQTIEGWNAISVWCVTAGANFGSGTFAAVLAGDFDDNGIVDGDDFLFWQRDPSIGSLADWEANYGMVAPITAISAVVPEPATEMMLILGMAVMMFTGGRMLVSKPIR